MSACVRGCTRAACTAATRCGCVRVGDARSPCRACACRRTTSPQLIERQPGSACLRNSPIATILMATEPIVTRARPSRCSPEPERRTDFLVVARQPPAMRAVVTAVASRIGRLREAPVLTRRVTAPVASSSHACSTVRGPRGASVLRLAALFEDSPPANLLTLPAIAPLLSRFVFWATFCTLLVKGLSADLSASSPAHAAATARNPRSPHDAKAPKFRRPLVATADLDLESRRRRLEKKKKIRGVAARLLSTVQDPPDRVPPPLRAAPRNSTELFERLEITPYGLLPPRSG